MSNVWVILLSTIGLIALSAFFVAVEFASLAAKRHRLEDAAPNSRSARAALRSSTELTVLLAGSQLGITACTLALGAVTKPAVHHWITPLLEGWGAALWLADVAGFVLALIVVTFLHLVVGEMAPKSWAIAHPELSATVLAIPMRAFMWAARPLLRVLNDIANWCLRRVGVEPADQVATGQNADDLRQLVEHSANVGALDAGFSAHVSGALGLRELKVRELIGSGTPTAVDRDATVAELQQVARSSGHLRILVTGPEGHAEGVVHVRDTLTHPPEARAASLMRLPFKLDGNTPVYTALAAMRETRKHLAVVTGPGQEMLGVVTLADVLKPLLPSAGDRPTTTAAR